ncbi:hypothetical protein COV11_00825 [Candidatus Woesearchaeota archaeon CG10_big_fil_rev_8_21_14_0_10_30_7]|nr:MAG: hypothetical protein COV11_00825 [Candidatus Woesearchaeota archaeon CG10_big_fil_rev_8_21_14_0_10_30_7]
MVKKKHKNEFSTLIDILKLEKIKKVFFISTVLSLIVYSFLYGIWKIPFLNLGINRTSEIVMNDYLFLILISVLLSLLIALIYYEKKNALVLASSGGFIGLLSAICPVCQSIGIVAFGSTLLNIPTAFLVPYLGFLKLASVLLLVLAVYLKIDHIHGNTCKTCKTKKSIHKKYKEPFILRNNIALTLLVVWVLLAGVNNLLIPKAFATTSLVESSGGSVSLGAFEYGPKMTLKPMPLAAGEQPAIASYKSKVKSLPTISELQMKPLTGDAVQDVLNNIIPTGTPWYGTQAGVSFDDPITAQNLWAKGKALQLSPDEEQRWSRIVNSFTCDYCCGSPQNPTIITRCGCAHAGAAQGMAKWFVKNYGDSYSDEEIYGEMARWYALWYPGPTIKRIMQEAQAS